MPLTRNLSFLEPLFVPIKRVKQSLLGTEERPTGLRQFPQAIGQTIQERTFLPEFARKPVEKAVSFIQPESSEEAQGSGLLNIGTSEQPKYFDITGGGALKTVGRKTTENIGKYILSKVPKINKVLLEDIVSKTQLLQENKIPENEIIKYIDNEISAIKPLSIFGKRIPQELQPLAQEARKYKSAEEFVKAQGTPVYHQTNAEFNKFDNRDIAFFSTDKKTTTYGRNTIEAVLDYKKPYDAGYWLPESELRTLIPKLKEQGYDSVIYRGTPDDMSKIRDIVVFEPGKQVKTKSQLTSIWNEANQAVKGVK